MDNIENNFCLKYKDIIKMLSKITRNLSHTTNSLNRKFSTISHVKAREIIDSRGNPTVEADVVLTNG
jgi:hypothetical protein